VYISKFLESICTAVKIKFLKYYKNGIVNKHEKERENREDNNNNNNKNFKSTSRCNYYVNKRACSVNDRQTSCASVHTVARCTPECVKEQCDSGLCFLPVTKFIITQSDYHQINTSHCCCDSWNSPPTPKQFLPYQPVTELTDRLPNILSCAEINYLCGTEPFPASYGTQ
jgi:hypothetical protein